jgi:signal transduction histidine kinase
MVAITPGTNEREIGAKVYSLRAEGKLEEAIELCEQADNESPRSYFFKKILGDLHFKRSDYDKAAQFYFDFLKKLPPNEIQFSEFAKRYYRLARVWRKARLAAYAKIIMLELQRGRISEQNAARIRALITSDIPSEPSAGTNLSSEGAQLVKMLSGDTLFKEVTDRAKWMGLNEPGELAYVLDSFILNRGRSLVRFGVDMYCVALYERLEKYEKAVKVAEELLSLRLDPTLIASFFRICRKMGKYERADKLLDQHPQIVELEKGAFNVLYELVYYYENRNDFPQVRSTLSKIESSFTSRVPIMQTLKNLYIRFGMVEDAQRVDEALHGILGGVGPRRYKNLVAIVKESEAEIGSKIKELYSELQHQTRLAAITDLATGISHELGQPITNIRYTIQFYQKLFKQNLERETVLTVFESILEETKRMGGLIKRLAPITSSRNVIENFDLLERVGKRVHAERVRLEQANISVNVAPRIPVYLFGDPVKFDQLISNLLLNSIDAIRERGADDQRIIEIDLAETAEEVKITFTDTGVGVPAKNRGKVFDPFFSTKAPGKGEGLGLFIVWNLLKMQGGKISLDPWYQNGARFLISIPKTSKYDEEEVDEEHSAVG